MRKSFIFVLSLFFVFWITRASYESESIDRFINSPSYEKLQFITDERQRFCEETFLDAYRRREFSEEENLICSDIFERKIEDELNYKKQVFSERWVY